MDRYLKKCDPFLHGVRVHAGTGAGAIIASQLSRYLNLHLSLTISHHACLNSRQERNHRQVVVRTWIEVDGRVMEWREQPSVGF